MLVVLYNPIKLTSYHKSGKISPRNLTYRDIVQKNTTQNDLYATSYLKAQHLIS